MGPRLFSRGNVVNVHLFNNVLAASMGPRLFSRGNDERWHIRGSFRKELASMGPRLFSRGNTAKYCFCGPSIALLQWGHDFSAVEMRTASPEPTGSCLHRFNGATTFQPWKSTPLPLRLVDSHELQWGHDFSAVEIRHGFACMSSRFSKLQWGHDFSAVEIAAVFRPQQMPKN